MADVTAAAWPVYLGGQEYFLSPLSDEDNEELNNWLRASFIQMARESLPDGATREEREETLGIALREARALSWFSHDGSRVVKTIDGVARVLWQSLKKRHPDLTHARVRKLITDPATIDYVMSVWREANVGNAVKGGTQDGSPKANRRSRRRPRRRSTQS